MAPPQFTLDPFPGSKKENVSECELPFQSILVVAALKGNQQANFSHLHLRDTVLQLFQTLSLATRQNLELSITALHDRCCNPQLQKIYLLKLGNLNFD